MQNRGMFNICDHKTMSYAIITGACYVTIYKAAWDSFAGMHARPWGSISPRHEAQSRDAPQPTRSAVQGIGSPDQPAQRQSLRL